MRIITKIKNFITDKFKRFWKFIFVGGVAVAIAATGIPTNEVGVTIVFNPSGTHIKDGQLKVRIDIYPEKGSQAYAEQYVDVIDPITELPTGEKRLNPMLSHFITISPDTSKEELTNYINQILTPDNLKTIEDNIVFPNSIHRISPFMRNKSVLAKKEVGSIDLNEINAKFSGISILKAGGTGTILETGTIDIGPGAIDRSGRNGAGYTKIDLANSANAAGTIDTWELWYAIDAGVGVVAGTLYGSGTDYTSRDSEAIGAVTAGSKQTFTGLSTDVQTGDFAGVYESGGTIERATSGGSGLYAKSGNQFGAGIQTYGLDAGWVISIYGTGVETSVGTNWGNIQAQGPLNVEGRMNAE